MAEKGFKRKPTTIRSADIVGYSRLLEADEMATVHTLVKYCEMIAIYIIQHRVRGVDSPVDNLFSEFNSVVCAVKCAVEIQRRNAERIFHLAGKI